MICDHCVVERIRSACRPGNLAVELRVNPKRGGYDVLVSPPAQQKQTRWAWVKEMLTQCRC